MTRSKAGFSLIEALAALAIVSMALLAFYELQQQLVRGERRSEEAIAQAELQRNALALTRDLNPMLEPRGAVALAGGRRVRWSSTPLTPSHPDVGTTGARYDVALYRLQVEVVDSVGRRLTGLSFERVGWRRRASAAPSTALSGPAAAARLR